MPTIKKEVLSPLKKTSRSVSTSITIKKVMDFFVFKNSEKNNENNIGSNLAKYDPKTRLFPKKLCIL